MVRDAYCLEVSQLSGLPVPSSRPSPRSTGDHPPGDKRDEEKGEEDLERPERGLGCPGGQEGDASA